VTMNPAGRASTGTATQTAATATDKAGEVASAATDSAGQVASTAVEQARQVAGEAKAQVSSLVADARGTVRGQAETQTQQLADALARLGDQARALLEGRPDDAPALTGHARNAADQLDQMAGRLRTGGVDGLLHDLRSFARRRPGTFLLGAGLAGFAAGRLVRASRDADGGDAPASPPPYRAGVSGPAELGQTSAPPAVPAPLIDEPVWPEYQPTAGVPTSAAVPPLPGGFDPGTGSAV
jgi:hypothetical protein